MAGASFSIVHVGPHTSVQDGGRKRMMRFGVAASGPMDNHGFAVAHAALGNVPGSPAIEISVGGLVVDCTQGSCTFAIAGGGFQVSVGGARHASWTVARISAGERLIVRPGVWGSWTYLAFAGTLQVPHWLGSAATHSQSGFGGGILRSGSPIVIEDASILEAREGDIPLPSEIQPPGAARVVLGPQERFFPAQTIAAFLSQPFALTEAYDRMGVRLSGPDLRPSAMLDMPSEAVARGSVQVAGDGVATVLLADHQTTGGYPKIATVIACDLDRFVQLRSRDRVRFTSVGPEEGIQIARREWNAREAYLSSVRGRATSLSDRLMTLNLIDGAIVG